MIACPCCRSAHTDTTFPPLHPFLLPAVQATTTSADGLAVAALGLAHGRASGLASGPSSPLRPRGGEAPSRSNGHFSKRAAPRLLPPLAVNPLATPEPSALDPAPLAGDAPGHSVTWHSNPRFDVTVKPDEV